MVRIWSILTVALRKESVDRNANPGSTELIFPGSLSTRRAWIEMSEVENGFAGVLLSLSARRAWIEICPTCQWRRSVKVALRKESVDRNNLDRWIAGLKGTVALRKESVDRNFRAFAWKLTACPSLSARRAWIEILSMGLDGRFKLVALRKESVDRNSVSEVYANFEGFVALRKESVDRNTYLLGGYYNVAS